MGDCFFLFVLLHIKVLVPFDEKSNVGLENFVRRWKDVFTGSNGLQSYSIIRCLKSGAGTNNTSMDWE
jgi:hypothetical protein